jgi:hypothetical protein
VFQTLSAGKTSHLDPGTGAADAGTAIVKGAAHTATAAVATIARVTFTRTSSAPRGA